MNLVAESLTIPRDGETHNGDAAVTRVEGGRMLAAVIDGLGHGAKAEVAALQAVDVLERASLDSEALELIEDVHRALRGSRGAAATLFLLNDGELEGCGVGNVELRSTGTKVPALLSPGILGANVRKFRLFRCSVEVPTRIVMYSDGLDLKTLDDVAALEPAQACQTLMDDYRRPLDDATVLVADIAT